MRIYATQEVAGHEMTLYAEWYSADGKRAMQEDGTIIDLEEEGFKLKIEKEEK